MTLAYLTINSNYTRMSPRSEVLPKAIEAVAPWTRDTGNAAPILPAIGMGGRVHVDSVAGMASIEILTQPSGLAVIGFLAWKPDGESHAWPRILDMSRALGIIASRLDKPKSLPWLACGFTASMPTGTLVALTELEQCWAWAVLERWTKASKS